MVTFTTNYGYCGTTSILMLELLSRSGVPNSVLSEGCDEKHTDLLTAVGY